MRKDDAGSIKDKKKMKWTTEEILKTIKDRWEAKVKVDKSKISILNAVFQRLSYRDKENYNNNQCKDIEENN